MTLNRAIAAIDSGLHSGDHLGAQLYVSVNGVPVCDLGFGVTGPGQPVSPTTAVPWLCSGKPITSVGLLQLHQRGVLSVDDPLSRYFAELKFGPDADRVLIRDLLTHRLSFPLDTLSHMSNVGSIDGMLRSLRNEENSPTHAGNYSLFSNWLMLAELIQRVDGRKVEQFLIEEVLMPAGMTSTSVSPETATGTPKLRKTGATDPKDVARLYRTGRGFPMAIPWVAEAMRRVSPGLSVVGPIRELGWFYESLFHVLKSDKKGSQSPLSPGTLKMLLSRYREDLVFSGQRFNWPYGLGMMLGATPFADCCSDDTFGHDGYGSSFGLCDPYHGLVIAFFANGVKSGARRTRMASVITNVYRDLSLERGLG